MPVSLRLAAAGASDPGLQRDVNEDRFHCDSLHGIFFVVDGVGGQAAGERAADIARDVLRKYLSAPGPAERRLGDAVTAANNEIFDQASRRSDWTGMACVLTAVVLDGGDAVVGHVGDTRLYKLRRGRIDKLTRDHSPVGEREDDHELTELEAMRHPRRNEVYRDVGSERHLPGDPGFVDVFRVPFEPDAALLLCSDGLTDCVTSAAVRDVVEDLAGDPESVVQGLVGAANRAGGKDNVTAVYVEGPRFVSGEDTRELSAARSAADSLREPAALPPEDDRSSATRSRWRLMALVVLLLATIGLSGYELRRRLIPPRDVVGSAAGARQLIVAAGDSIAAVIERARPGDEVLVEPGEYREQVSLKSGVRVRSRVARAAAIRLPGGAHESDAAVQAVDVAAAELSGFRILGDAATPLGTGVLVRNAAVVLSDLEVTGARLVGVEFSGVSEASLLGSLIHENAGAGLIIRSGASPRIEHNTFRQNGSSPQAPGPVFIEPDTAATFKENVFVGIAPASITVPAGDRVLRENSFLPQPPAQPAGRESRDRRSGAAPARSQSRGPR